MAKRSLWEKIAKELEQAIIRKGPKKERKKARAYLRQRKKIFKKYS
jgi:hypothetical protein